MYADPASTVTALAALKLDIRLAVDERTRSIIASGPPDALAIAEALLLKLDEKETLQSTNATRCEWSGWLAA